MDVHDLFTPESVAEFRLRTAEAAGPGQQLLSQYRQDHADQLRAAPDLQAWIDALEDGDLAAATDGDLWSRLCAQGFIECPLQPSPYPDRAVFLFRFVSPRIFDGFRTPDGVKSDYAFNRVKVCLRRDAVPASFTTPEGWSNTALIDTELFELPAEVSGDMFDDMEKIHLIYLAGIKDGQFVSKAVYIGIGTGEAYGTGPSRRATQGRFRLYRYDRNDNFHVEYVRLTEGRDYEQKDVQSVPAVPLITETKATLVLAASVADSSFMSISDPHVARWHAMWLRTHPKNHLVFQEIVLEKIHEDLPEGQRANTPFPADNVAQALAHAWNIQRWYYIAWQHPERLCETEGIEVYYDELPTFRREQYEIYRFKPEIFGLTPDDPAADDLTVPHVLRTDPLGKQLTHSHPNEFKCLERWLLNCVVQDLYAYGSHPELRLCTAIALWSRLAASGLWDQAVEATHRRRLFEVELSAERLCGVASGKGEG